MLLRGGIMLLLFNAPAAIAHLYSNDEKYNITGTVKFFPYKKGTMVVADIHGLPNTGAACSSGVFAFHIHEGGSCAGEGYPETGGHYNPGKCPHPYHAGDLPPLFSNGGDAFMIVYTDRFSVQDVIGRTVVIHAQPDDFTTQPAGNSGPKIACGVILHGSRP